VGLLAAPHRDCTSGGVGRVREERLTAMVVATVLGALLLGFLAGLLAFKVRTRWCPECGATTMTLEQHRRQAGARSR